MKQTVRRFARIFFGFSIRDVNNKSISEQENQSANFSVNFQIIMEEMIKWNELNCTDPKSGHGGQKATQKFAMESEKNNNENVIFYVAD